MRRRRRKKRRRKRRRSKFLSLFLPIIDPFLLKNIAIRLPTFDMYSWGHDYIYILSLAMSQLGYCELLAFSCHLGNTVTLSMPTYPCDDTHTQFLRFIIKSSQSKCTGL